MRWKALLLDVDGTLCFRGRLIPGADEAVAQFRRRGCYCGSPPTSIRARPRVWLLSSTPWAWRCCGIQARVLGKPSPEFFARRLADPGLEPREVAVVGDDPASDVAGARAVGACAVQVRDGEGKAAVSGTGPRPVARRRT
jgi:ribonucleotide monophosphatase NagD (HAD superfamily)